MRPLLRLALPPARALAQGRTTPSAVVDQKVATAFPKINTLRMQDPPERPGTSAQRLTIRLLFTYPVAQIRE